MEIDEGNQDRDEERHPEPAFRLGNEGRPNHPPQSYPKVPEIRHQSANPLELIVVGHLTIDHVNGSERVGGAAAYASLTARHLGVNAAVVTSVSSDFPYWDLFAGIESHTLASRSTTWFETLIAKDAAASACGRSPRQSGRAFDGTPSRGECRGAVLSRRARDRSAVDTAHPRRTLRRGAAGLLPSVGRRRPGRQTRVGGCGARPGGRRLRQLERGRRRGARGDGRKVSRPRVRHHPRRERLPRVLRSRRVRFSRRAGGSRRPHRCG